MDIFSDLSNITWALVLAMLVLILYFHGPSYSAQTVKTAPSILTSFGIFVELDDVYVEGLVHISALPGDYYHFDQDKNRLQGERTGRSFR